MNKKQRKAFQKRKELEKKIKFKMDDLSLEDKESLRAIAIKYDKTSKKAPIILASGRGKIAASILSLAEEHDIPMMQDKKLSKLLTSLKINREIPVKLFQVIAEVLAYVFYLEKMSKRKAKFNQKFRRVGR